MMNRELAANIEPVQTLDPATLTTNNTTVAGGAVDLQGFNSATILANVGEWGDTTTGGWEIGVQHSDDTVSGNFVDVPNDQLTDTVAGDSTVTGAQSTGVFAVVDAADEDDAVYKTGYIGAKRYLRYFLTATGNQTNGTPLAITVVKGHANIAPTS